MPPRMRRSPARLHCCGVLGPWKGWRPRVPRFCAPWVLCGGRPAAWSASGVGLPGPVPGWPASGASPLPRAAMSGGRLAGLLACWFFGWPVTPLGMSAGGGPRAGRSAAGSGASFRCGGPPASSMASTVGSSRCGWAGGAGGAAASSASCVAARVWPSGTGAGLGWPPTWPASARVRPFPSAAAGLAAGKGGSDPNWLWCSIFERFSRFQRFWISFQQSSEIILFINHRMEDLTFLVLTRPVVCARALLVLLLACACSVFLNAGRSFRNWSQRVLIVLVLHCYKNGNESEARATAVDDRRHGVKDLAKHWCGASAHTGY